VDFHSNFSDIFDVDWFISSVAQDVQVIKEPVEALRGKSAYSRGIPRKAKPEYYLSQILPILKKRKVIHTPLYRLTVTKRILRVKGNLIGGRLKILLAQ